MLVIGNLIDSEANFEDENACSVSVLARGQCPPYYLKLILSLPALLIEKYNSLYKTTMPLTANCEDNKRICALDFKDAHEIRAKYNQDTLTCPFCNIFVHPRQREGYLTHFVHKSLCSTKLAYHPESPEHLLGKEVLFKHLKEQVKEYDVEVQIEYPIPEAGENGRIADVAAIYKTGYVLIYECQLSAITTDKLEQRTIDYEKEGCEVVWWFGKSADTEANRNWARSRYSVSYQLLFSERNRIISLPK
jgi:competence CoiA-like predicted nuclease